MSQPNKYRTQCAACGSMIAPGDGVLTGKANGRWQARHHDCNGKDSKYISHLFVTSSGTEIMVNKRGRCEDAPCCGCCS